MRWIPDSMRDAFRALQQPEDEGLGETDSEAAIHRTTKPGIYLVYIGMKAQAYQISEA